MSTTATRCCSLCEGEIVGIPYGPLRAEVCAACWFEAGTYKEVEQRAFAKNPPPPLKTKAGIPQDDADEIESVADALDDIARDIRSALESGDLKALTDCVNDIRTAAYDLEGYAK